MLSERDKQIAEEAARKALTEFFPALGLPPDASPRDLSRLLATRALLEDPMFAEDLAFVRRLRSTTEKVANQSIRTVVSIVVTVFLGILLLGTKDWWMRHVTG